MNIREMRAQLGDTQSEFSARYPLSHCAKLGDRDA